MHLQAYMDESFDGDLFVLAGYVSTIDKWERFSQEWGELLPLAPINKRGVREFKMSHMMSVPDRRSDVQAFYNVIKRHTEVGIFASIRLDTFNEVKSWFSVESKKFPILAWENPYFVAWRMLFQGLHDHRSENGMTPRMFSDDEVIDFIFDERSEEGRVQSEFKFIYSTSSGVLKKLFGKPPRFEKSDDYLPLQAADMLAWYARDRRIENDLSNIFCEWERSPSTLPVISMILTPEYHLLLLLQVYTQHTPKSDLISIRHPRQLEPTVKRVLAEIEERRASNSN